MRECRPNIVVAPGHVLIMRLRAKAICGMQHQSSVAGTKCRLQHPHSVQQPAKNFSLIAVQKESKNCVAYFAELALNGKSQCMRRLSLIALLMPPLCVCCSLLLLKHTINTVIAIVIYLLHILLVKRVNCLII